MSPHDGLWALMALGAILAPLLLAWLILVLTERARKRKGRQLP